MPGRMIDQVRSLAATRKSMGDGTLTGRWRIATPRRGRSRQAPQPAVSPGNVVGRFVRLLAAGSGYPVDTVEWTGVVTQAGWAVAVPATAVGIPARGYYDVRGELETPYTGSLSGWLEVDGVRVWPADAVLDAFDCSGRVFFDLAVGPVPAGAVVSVHFDPAIEVTSGRAIMQLVDRQKPVVLEYVVCPDGLAVGQETNMSAVAGDTRALNPWRIEPFDDDTLLFVTQDRSGVDPADYFYRAHLVERAGDGFSVLDTVDRDAIPANVSVGIRGVVPFNSTDMLLTYWNSDDYYYIHYRRVGDTITVVGDGLIGSSGTGRLEGGYLVRLNDGTMAACAQEGGGVIRWWIINRSGDVITVGSPVDVTVPTEGEDGNDTGFLAADGDRIMFVYDSADNLVSSPHDNVVRAAFFDRSGDTVTFDVATTLIGPFDAQAFMCGAAVHAGAFYTSAVARPAGSGTNPTAEKADVWKLSPAGAVLHHWDFGAPGTGRWYNALSTHEGETPIFFWSPDSTTNQGHNATAVRLDESEPAGSLCAVQGGDLQARRANVWTPGLLVCCQAGEGTSTTSIPVLRTVVET